MLVNCCVNMSIIFHREVLRVSLFLRRLSFIQLNQFKTMPIVFRPKAASLRLNDKREDKLS